MKVTLHDGPFDGAEIEANAPSETVGVPVDADLRHTLGDQFAHAIYRRAEPNGSDYCFCGIQCMPGKAFQTSFVGGPVAGLRRVPSPPIYGPNQFDVLLDEDGLEYAENGEPAAVAVYERTVVDGEFAYLFMETFKKGERMDNARLAVAKRRGKLAAEAFYASMDYKIYSQPPTGDHKQVFVEVGQRRAFVDEKMAGVIEKVWRLGLDTAGSCQERSSGKAYIGFSVPGHGEEFVALFAGVNIDLELKPTTMGIQNAKTGEKIELTTANVLFSPNVIDEVESHLASLSS